MDRKHLLGIPEIDVQHAAICELLAALRNAIALDDQRHLIHPALKRLHHLLATHFRYEEEMMRMMNYPDLQQHTKSHNKVLLLLKTYFDHPLAPGDHDAFGKAIHDKLSAHIVEHDTSMHAMIGPRVKVAPRGQ